MVYLHKNARNICVAICPGFSKNIASLPGLVVKLAFSGYIQECKINKSKKYAITRNLGNQNLNPAFKTKRGKKTKITNFQNTIGQPSEQPFPKRSATQTELKVI